MFSMCAVAVELKITSHHKDTGLLWREGGEELSSSENVVTEVAMQLVTAPIAGIGW